MGRYPLRSSGFTGTKPVGGTGIETDGGSAIRGMPLSGVTATAAAGAVATEVLPVDALALGAGDATGATTGVEDSALGSGVVPVTASEGDTVEGPATLVEGLGAGAAGAVVGDGVAMTVWVVVDGLSPIATPARSMTGGRRAALRFTGAVAAAEGTAACADVLVDAPEACAFGAGAAVRGVLDRVTGHLVEAEKTPPARVPCHCTPGPRTLPTSVGTDSESVGTDFESVNTDSGSVGTDFESVGTDSESVGTDFESVGTDFESTTQGATSSGREQRPVRGQWFAPGTMPGSYAPLLNPSPRGVSFEPFELFERIDLVRAIRGTELFVRRVDRVPDGRQLVSDL